MRSASAKWLQRNWQRLNYFSPVPIEGLNQTTQAPYCAAYLSVLAIIITNLFIPALSEHNAGGTNVGLTSINGEHLGAEDIRAQDFLGSKLARDLRALPGMEWTRTCIGAMVLVRTFMPRWCSATPSLSGT